MKDEQMLLEEPTTSPLLTEVEKAEKAFSWPSIPYPAFLATAGVCLVGALLVVVVHRYDKTNGLVTVSLILIVAFIAATFASMLYSIPQVPSTEILIGGLATALGAIVAYWLGHKGERP